MIFFLVISFLSFVVAQTTPSPRWAQAVSLLEDTLYVHGGLSDPSNSYTYSSAPELSDLLVLDLSISFNSSSPPWQLFSANASPAVAWHTLSAFSTTELLMFGGQPGPNSQEVLMTLNDSSGLLSTVGKSGPFFLMEPQNWKNEPMRRIRHSSSYTSGKVWIIGGEKADGSGNAFSDHYAFNPSGPEFIQLPSSSAAPPDIYGHASLVLSDGRLLVLGGYCASCSGLVPMDTVWSLNTTTSTPIWEKVFVSDQSLPSPRRDFAAVVLPTSQVLIHGGGDGQLETTYSDGWVLDTGQNPMVWSNVAALAQLGQRKDHLAVQASGYVLFCFGYGSSSPASASLFIYDPMTSSMVTSYTASSPDSTPGITSLPDPSPTGLDPNPGGVSSTASPGGTPGSPSYTSGSSTGSRTRTTAIVLGTTFGVLGLVAAGVGTMYYMKRARNRDSQETGRFLPLEDSPELSEDGSVRGSQPEAVRLDCQDIETGRATDGLGVMTGILAHLGVNKFGSRSHQPRRDMFADEDARSFGWVGPSSTVHRQGSGGTSAWSLRSVGALVRGVIGREPSGSEADQGNHEWEKMDNLRQGGEEDLIRQGSRSTTPSHPIHRKDASPFSYTDPFQDSLSDDDYYDLELRPGIPEKDADYDNCIPRSGKITISEWPSLSPQDYIRPFPQPSLMLTPLKEVSCASLTEDSLPSLRESSHQELIISCRVDNATLTPPASTSSVSYSPTLTRSSDPHATTFVPRYSTISGSTSSHSPSISRHDTWWTRITKSPLIDRRTSITSSKPLDFRDPRPAPPLAACKESKKSVAAPALSDDTLVDIPVRHGRSLSSAHSGRTANTDSAEHLGGNYDVVQRFASDGSSSRRAPSLASAEITEQGIFTSAVDNPAPAEGAPSSILTYVDPPRSALSSAVPAHSMEIESETSAERLMSSHLNLTSPKRGAVVSNKIRAYEHRLSQELGSQKTPSLRNTRRREEVPSRTRPTIQYGVAPRPSLFIANPDLGHLP